MNQYIKEIRYAARRSLPDSGESRHIPIGTSKSLKPVESRYSITLGKPIVNQQKEDQLLGWQSDQETLGSNILNSLFSNLKNYETKQKLQDGKQENQTSSKSKEQPTKLMKVLNKRNIRERILENHAHKLDIVLSAKQAFWRPIEEHHNQRTPSSAYKLIHNKRASLAAQASQEQKVASNNRLYSTHNACRPQLVYETHRNDREAPDERGVQYFQGSSFPSRCKLVRRMKSKCQVKDLLANKRNSCIEQQTSKSLAEFEDTRIFRPLRS